MTVSEPLVVFSSSTSLVSGLEGAPLVSTFNFLSLFLRLELPFLSLEEPEDEVEEDVGVGEVDDLLGPSNAGKFVEQVPTVERLCVFIADLQ